ncbi:MAG: tetratricopeptide repeat protein [Rubrivivax sp.]|nr:tetratricopeptide repeat protein [Rubrivivax sp.]
MTRSLQELRSRRLQIDALREAGSMDEAAYAKARAQVDRELADAVLAQTPAAARRVPWNWIGLGVAGALAAAGIYLKVAEPAPAPAGPSVPTGGQSGAAAQPSGAPHALEKDRMDGMARTLEKRLKDNPGDAAGWAMLARTYTVLGRPADALPAYRQAESLRPDDPVLLADYADALAMTQGQRIAGEPMKLVERALKLDPDNLKALSLAGTEAFDREDWKAALAHWERLRSLAPADNPLAQQIQGGIEEARRRAGLPQEAAAASPAKGGTEAPAAAAAAGGARVGGTVSLAAPLASQAAPDDTVFIFARAAQGSRMPLAVLRRQVRDLPIQFSLDDSMAMSPAARLSTAPQVIVGARISKSGQAMPQPGDLLGETEPVAPGRLDLKIQIDRAVPR